MQFTYMKGTSFANLKLLLHKVYFIINTLLFPSLHKKLYARTVKSFADTSEIFTHAVFQLVVVVGKTASSECILQGATKTEVGGCEIGTVGKFEPDTSKIQLPGKLNLLGRRRTDSLY
jgi:hypothetical protein